MIKSRIQIEGDDKIYDLQSIYGLVQVSSDDVFGAPLKEFERTTYPEEHGSHVIPSAIQKEFDYKVKFLVKCENGLDYANWAIARFNSDMIKQSADGIPTLKQITFYNDFKKVKVVGYPLPFEKATQFWRDKNGKLHDVVIVELTIKVTNPSLCNFNIAEEEWEAFYVQQEVFYVRKTIK